MKINETGLNTLLENLNTLICEDSLLTRPEKEDLIRAVAAIGAMKARVGMNNPVAQITEEKNARIVDHRFPHAGDSWREEESHLLLDALKPVPDNEIGIHLFWLAEKLGRTPYSVACKIAVLRKMPNKWKEQFREISDNIRKSELTITEYVQQNGIDLLSNK